MEWDKTELNALSGTIITLNLSLDILCMIRRSLSDVYVDYQASANYWYEHMMELEAGDHALAIPFANFMSLVAALLASNQLEKPLAGWIRQTLICVADSIEALAPAAAETVNMVALQVD